MSSSSRIRFSAQRFGTWEWLSFDLPLKTEGPPLTHTSYDSMTATISPEIGRRLADDGRRLIEPWGTWIHVEVPGGREWTGIVDEVSAEGAVLEVSIREWVGYLDGLVFTGRIWGVRDDPADLVRELFAHVQSFTNGKLGATVTGTTPVRVGSPSEDAAIGARWERNNAKLAWEERAKPRKALQANIKSKSKPFDKQIRTLNREKRPLMQTYQAVVKAQKPVRDAYSALTQERTRLRAVVDAHIAAGASDAVIAAANAAVVAMADGILAAKVAADALNPARDLAKAPVDLKNAQIAVIQAEKDVVVGPLREDLEDLTEAEEPYKVALDKAEETLRAAEERLKEDGGAYKVLSHDHPNCWKVLTDLAAATPFDFVTSTKSTTGAPELTLAIRYPGTGRVRDDLIFEHGRNIIAQPTVEIPDDYASEVIAAGAGQGDSIEGWDLHLETTVTAADDRMRRNDVYSDPSITSKSVLNAVGRAELKARRAPIHIPEIVVKDDPNCPIGAWAAGDIITVKLNRVPHFGRVVVKHRIRSWQRVGTHKAKIRLEPV